MESRYNEGGVASIGRAKAVDRVRGVDSEMAEKTRLHGYVTRVVGGAMERIKPRYSDREIHAIERASLPPDDITLNNMLEGFPLDWARSYYRHNKFVHVEDGIDVVPRIPSLNLLTEEDRSVERSAAHDVLDEYDRQATIKKKVEKDRVKRKKYFLTQVLNDSDVAVKLGVAGEVLTVISRTAVSNPTKACNLVVKCAKEIGQDITVAPGDYAKSRKAARDVILGASRGSTLPPYTCDVIGDDLVLTSLSNDPDSGKPDWVLRGSLWQAPELNALHSVASFKGPTAIGALFGVQMAMLGITLELPSDYGMDYEEHFGYIATNSPPPTKARYPSCVVGFENRIAAVVSSDGRVVGTAVLKGAGSLCYVVWHVIDGLLTQQGDGPVSVRLPSGDIVVLRIINQVSSDVWLAEYESDCGSGYQPAVVRAAKVGEYVVGLYAASNGVEYTDPVRVERVEKNMVVTDVFPQAQFGMSGAAVVSAEDGCLVSIYTGSGREWSLSSSVHNPDGGSWMSKYVEYSALPSAVKVGVDASGLYSDLKARGLSNDIRVVASSLSPLFSSGVQVGVAVAAGEVVHTILDPAMWDLVGPDGVAARFSRSDYGGRRQGSSMAFNARSAVPGEKVFAVTVDTTGVFFSNIMDVSWVSSTSDKFRTSASPKFEDVCFEGAVMVALADAAVLGVNYRSYKGDKVDASECVSWSSIAGVGSDDLVMSMLSSLSSRLPELVIGTWTKEDCESLDFVKSAEPPGRPLLRKLGVDVVSAVVMTDIVNSGGDVDEGVVAVALENGVWLERVWRYVFPDGGGLYTKRERGDWVKVLLGVVYARVGAAGMEKLLDSVFPKGLPLRE